MRRAMVVWRFMLRSGLKILRKRSRLELSNRWKTSNIQPRTPNNQWPSAWALIGCWMFDVGCWMFPGFIVRLTLPRRFQFQIIRMHAAQHFHGHDALAVGGDLFHLLPQRLGVVHGRAVNFQ